MATPPPTSTHTPTSTSSSTFNRPVRIWEMRPTLEGLGVDEEAHTRDENMVLTQQNEYLIRDIMSLNHYANSLSTLLREHRRLAAMQSIAISKLVTGLQCHDLRLDQVLNPTWMAMLRRIKDEIEALRGKAEPERPTLIGIEGLPGLEEVNDGNQNASVPTRSR